MVQSIDESQESARILALLVLGSLHKIVLYRSPNRENLWTIRLMVVATKDTLRGYSDSKDALKAMGTFCEH